MENPENPVPKVVTQYNLKQAIFSIVIGVLTSGIIMVLQEVIQWLQSIPPEAVGGFFSGIRYWKVWHYNTYV